MTYTKLTYLLFAVIYACGCTNATGYIPSEQGTEVEASKQDITYTYPIVLDYRLTLYALAEAHDLFARVEASTGIKVAWSLGECTDAVDTIGCLRTGSLEEIREIGDKAGYPPAKNPQGVTVWPLVVISTDVPRYLPDIVHHELLHWLGVGHNSEPGSLMSALATVRSMRFTEHELVSICNRYTCSKFDLEAANRQYFKASFTASGDAY